MNSRWSTSPIKRDGQLVSIRPNAVGDIEILKCLGRYAVLTAPDIAALTRRSYGAIIARLNLLKRKPNELITVHRAQLDSPRQFQWARQAYHLTNTGIAKLQELGFEPKPRPHSHFIHTVTESQVAASFEVGARAGVLEHIVLDETPIPVTFSWKGHTYDQHKLTPDIGPIGIGYRNGEYRFVVVEVDCASEPLTSSNRDRQAIETKLAGYLTVIEQRLFETHWRIPDLIVLFTSTTQTRVNNMRSLLHEMTNRYHNHFRFICFPTILSGAPQLRPGWAITETGLDKEN